MVFHDRKNGQLVLRSYILPSILHNYFFITVQGL